MAENYIGSTSIKSELTSHLFRDFRKAYWHFKERIEATTSLPVSFCFFIENNFDVMCDRAGTLTHIRNTEIEQYHARCEQMVKVLKTMELDAQDNIMLDVVVKTGNYLAIILDFIAQDKRLRQLERDVFTQGKGRKREAAPGLDSVARDLRMLSVLGQDVQR
jgi:hypothetical protein